MSTQLSQEFLSQIIAEFDDDDVRTIILHGSYARGDAVPPYSDVDLVRIVKESPNQSQKQFIWRGGYLLNLSSRPLSVYKEWLKKPEEAIYRLQTIREAHILLEKDSEFRTFQQEVCESWTWEPLQEAANIYAGKRLVEQTEIILKILRAIHTSDIIVLLDMILFEVLHACTEAIAVQRGILIKSGNSFLHQVQESVGRDSPWVQFFLDAVDSSISLERRGMSGIFLYRETFYLLQSCLSSEQKESINALLNSIPKEWL